MTALAIVVGLAVLLWVFVSYPKRTLQIGCSVAATLLVGIVALWYFFEERPRQLQTAREKKVLITVSYAPAACSAQTPLRVEITNTGPDTVKLVTWWVHVYRPGYSSNLAESSARYESDRILARGQAYQLCVDLPELNYDARHLDRAGLSYVVWGKSVDWVP